MKVVLSYDQALNKYFGTVKEIWTKPLPFVCTCGNTVLSEKAIWSHIKRVHKEKLKK